MISQGETGPVSSFRACAPRTPLISKGLRRLVRNAETFSRTNYSDRSGGLSTSSKTHVRWASDTGPADVLGRWGTELQGHVEAEHRSPRSALFPVRARGHRELRRLQEERQCGESGLRPISVPWGRPHRPRAAEETPGPVGRTGPRVCLRAPALCTHVPALVLTPLCVCTSVYVCVHTLVRGWTAPPPPSAPSAPP